MSTPTRVFLWAADFAGCHSYRMRFPKEAILEGPNASQFELATDTKIPMRWQNEADTVVGQRVCKEGPSRLWQRWAAEGDKRLVFELDDDLFNVDPENHRAFTTFNDPLIKENLRRNIRASHTVTVSTEPLAERIRRETGHEDVRVVPNAVPTWLLGHRMEERYTTGYMGSPTHHRDIKPVSRHVRRFFENNPEATFHSIGFDYGQFMGLEEKQRSHTWWLPNTDDALRALDFSFGIAPLAASVFARSKSSVKFLELAALGRPIVCSNVAAYDEIEHGVTGIKVRYEHEWRRALQDMYSDKDMREELGRNALQYVSTQRTMENVREQWESAYRA